MQIELNKLRYTAFLVIQYFRESSDLPRCGSFKYIGMQEIHIEEKKYKLLQAHRESTQHITSSLPQWRWQWSWLFDVEPQHDYPIGPRGCSPAG